MKKQVKQSAAAASQLRYGNKHPFAELNRFTPMGDGESELYRAMREAIPILDAAVQKLVRLTGGFSVSCRNKKTERALNQFLQTVACGRGQYGVHSFLSAYMDSLLTYGRAVGEMVVSQNGFHALCWGDVRDIHIRQGQGPLDVQLCACQDGQVKPLPYQDLLLFTTLNPEPAHPYGVSLFRSMPFLCDVLLKIYHTMGLNWERAGNVRYSVICKPQNGEMETFSATQRAEEVSRAWSRAMEESKSGSVRDFVAVGDVEIKAITADGTALDSQVPVRQILEQLVAKTGLPPFLLGLSWSNTERMSSQQADLLTSELWALRRAVEPTLQKICNMWLRTQGLSEETAIVWDEITLQDTVEEAHAGLYRAQTRQIEEELHGNP
ncbi:MAG: serine/threonine protein phosphatase [Oscillospiraceae bacterium]|nr:serine/threonine protein phosphatase [Oscillospiraceae bacterium]